MVDYEELGAKKAGITLTVSEECYQNVPWFELCPVLEQDARYGFEKLGKVVGGVDRRVLAPGEYNRGYLNLPDTDSEFYLVSFTGWVVPHEED